jgi:triosephosphate isomerase (TIM)
MTPSTVETRTYPKLAPMILLISTKAYFSPSRTLGYLKSLVDPYNGILPLPASSQSSIASSGALQLALIPDFLTIYPCAELLAQHSKSLEPASWPLLLGAQNCFWEASEGPYTGEIVPSSLRSLGCSIVELGHAERRRYLSETDETTARKAEAVCACGMIPLVCVGEVSGPARDGPMSMAVGNALREIRPQVTTVLEAVPKDAPVILAYEPVWAIGAEKPAGVEYVGPVVQAIREVVKKLCARTGETRVVYGGSAGPGLWGKGRLGEWVDGMFLGRFAHEISGVKSVVDEVVESMMQEDGKT